MDDLISRQVAIYNLVNIVKDFAKSDKQKALMGRCIYMMEHMPTVQPEQKTGQWLINSDGYYPYCSICKNEPQGRIMTDYCPNCGAKMEE